MFTFLAKIRITDFAKILTLIYFKAPKIDSLFFTLPHTYTFTIQIL